jgi:methionyl-tRNA formyltransferase
MNVGFAGTPAFAAHLLRALIDATFQSRSRSLSLTVRADADRSLRPRR